MDTFKKVLFIIAFTFISIHIMNLGYQIWFQPTSSVLDVYDEHLDAAVKQAESLAELTKRYDEAHRRVEEYESNPDSPPVVDHYAKETTEPYKTEIILRNAIKEWEETSQQIQKSRSYWLFGLVFLGASLASFRWINQWLGVSGLVVAFSEMIYWTSPTYFGSRSTELERLLYNNFGFGLATFCLLFVAAFLTQTLAKNGQRES